jgi:hypothetical protein
MAGKSMSIEEARFIVRTAEEAVEAIKVVEAEERRARDRYERERGSEKDWARWQLNNAQGRTERVKKAAGNGLDPLEVVQAKAVEKCCGAEWTRMLADAHERKAGEELKARRKEAKLANKAWADAWKAQKEADAGVAAALSDKSKTWNNGGRLAAARKIVAAADDQVVLRKASGLKPDANTDSAPVRRRSKGGI